MLFIFIGGINKIIKCAPDSAHFTHLLLTNFLDIFFWTVERFLNFIFRTNFQIRFYQMSFSISRGDFADFLEEINF